MASDGKVVPVAEATGSADQGPEQLQDVTDEEQQGGTLAVVEADERAKQKQQKAVRETPITRYKDIVAKRRELPKPAYVKTLLWGFDDDGRMAPPPRRKRKREVFEEVHEGRRLEKTVLNGLRGLEPERPIVYWARRPSHEQLGQNLKHSHKNFLPQKKNFSFCQLLVGMMLHYLVLFFYFGVLGNYKAFNENYISVDPPEGQPEWAPSSQAFIKKKYDARIYVRAYFDEQWLFTVGVVFGFQIFMFVWHFFFTHHRKGRWGRALRALVGVDCLWEFLVCLKKRDMTDEYRTLRRFEMVFRGLPMACMMCSVIIRFHDPMTNDEEEVYICNETNVYIIDGNYVELVEPTTCTRYHPLCEQANACGLKGALLFAVALSLMSGTMTAVDNITSMKPSSFWRIALKQKSPFGLMTGPIARVMIVIFCLTSVMMRVVTFAIYSVALERKIFETLAWIVFFRGFFYAVMELFELWGDDCAKIVFKKPKRGDPELVSKVERDKLSFVRMRGVEVFMYSWVFGFFWAVQSLLIDVPLVDMKAGRYFAGFLPVAAQALLSTIEIYASYDEACVSTMHPLPTFFGCPCVEATRDRASDLQCRPEHDQAEKRGGDLSFFSKGMEIWGSRKDISTLYGLHIACLALLFWITQRALTRDPTKMVRDEVDAEEIALDDELDAVVIKPKQMTKKERRALEAEKEEHKHKHHKHKHEHEEGGSGSDGEYGSGDEYEYGSGNEYGSGDEYGGSSGSDGGQSGGYSEASESPKQLGNG